MSTEYLIPEKFLLEIETFLTDNKKRISFNRFNKHVSPEFKKWLEERNIPSRFLIYVYKNNLTKIIIPTCPTCGKELSFKQIFVGCRFCSNKCKGINKEVREKTKQTCFEKYGVENPSQLKEVKEQKAKTCLINYGVENPNQSEVIRQKTVQTCLCKFGVKHPAQADAVKEKSKQTCLERYGVEYPLQSKEIREKVKQTCLEKYGVHHFSKTKIFKEKFKETSIEKYGVENPLGNKEIREKAKNTNLTKYGVENPLQSKEIQEKKKRNSLKKYGVEYFSQSKDFKQTQRSNHWETFCSRLKVKDIIPLFTKEEFVNDTGRNFKCLLCDGEFISEGTSNYKKEHKNKNGSYTTLLIANIHCPHCCKAPYSLKEKEVSKFVHSIYNGEILENVKGLFPNKQMELDIYLPQLNIGIEFDGTYWHSLENAKEKDEKKTRLCEQKGITLIRIKESEWDNNRDQIETQIKNILAT